MIKFWKKLSRDVGIYILPGSYEKKGSLDVVAWTKKEWNSEQNMIQSLSETNCDDYSICLKWVRVWWHKSKRITQFSNWSDLNQHLWSQSGAMADLIKPNTHSVWQNTDTHILIMYTTLHCVISHTFLYI